MRVREHAERAGIFSPSVLSRRVDIGLSTARRLWHSTSDGLEKGEPLQRIDFVVLERLCEFFHLPPGEFFERYDRPGN
jgi:transcriptional regulator with XRE-family HTH domain